MSSCDRPLTNITPPPQGRQVRVTTNPLGSLTHANLPFYTPATSPYSISLNTTSCSSTTLPEIDRPNTAPSPTLEALPEDLQAFELLKSLAEQSSLQTSSDKVRQLLESLPRASPWVKKKAKTLLKAIRHNAEQSNRENELKELTQNNESE